MADSIFCSQCGTRLDANARFCSSCGNVTVPAAVATTPAQVQPAAVASQPQPQPLAMAAAASAGPPAPPQQYGAVTPAYASSPGYVPSAALPYAGFWMRVGAYLIDVLVLFVPILILAFLPFIGIVLNIVGIWLYFALQESSERQATIGKRAMNIYVTDLQGRRLSFGQATGRHFSKIISSILAIGYIMVAFTEKKQGLHDMIAGTLVVRK